MRYIKNKREGKERMKREDGRERRWKMKRDNKRKVASVMIGCKQSYMPAR